MMSLEERYKLSSCMTQERVKEIKDAIKDTGYNTKDELYIKKVNFFSKGVKAKNIYFNIEDKKRYGTGVVVMCSAYVSRESLRSFEDKREYIDEYILNVNNISAKYLDWVPVTEGGMVHITVTYNISFEKGVGIKSERISLLCSRYNGSYLQDRELHGYKLNKNIRKNLINKILSSFA